MVTKKETAEQKLLKLIEASSGMGIATAKAQQQVVKKQNVLSVVKFVNQILLAGVIVAAAILCKEILSGLKLVNEKVTFTISSGKTKQPLSMDSIVPTIQNLTFYLSNIDRRNLFKPVEKQESRQTVEVSKENQRIAQRTSNLKLVGVSWLDQVDTASVMIEDTDKKITYFLRQGEKVGDVTVKTIYADSAVLGYDNEEIIIKYDKSQM